MSHLQSHPQPQQSSSTLLTKYQQKITSLFSHHTILLTTEIQNLKLLLRKNQEQLLKQKLAIDDMMEKVSIIEAKTDGKLAVLGKELENFRKYYDQCYIYTIARVNQVSQASKTNTLQLQSLLNAHQIPPSIPQYLTYAHTLLLSIIHSNTSKTQQLKYFLNEELYNLELELGKLKESIEQLYEIDGECKLVRYGCQSLKESLEGAVKMVMEVGNCAGNGDGMKDSQIGKKVVNYFEPKFKEILKRINGYSIEIQMVKMMTNSQVKYHSQYSQQKQQQMKELQQKLTQLQTSFQQQKKQYQKTLQKKQQIIKKRHERIIQLQQSLHHLHEKQIQIQHQNSELKMQNMEYAKEVKILSLKVQQMGRADQERRKEKEKDMGFQEKFVILEVEHANLVKKYYAQEAALQGLKNKIMKGETTLENSNTNNILSRSQKVIRTQAQFESPKHTAPEFQRSIYKTRHHKHSVPKLQTQFSPSDVKSSIKFSSTNPNFNKPSPKSQQFQLQLYNLYQQSQKLHKENRQLARLNKSLQQEINNFITAKAKQNKEDEEYLDEMEAELEKNVREIERLERCNLELNRKNGELVMENQRLEEELGLEIEAYEGKIKNYKNIIYQLQKKIENISVKNIELVNHLHQDDSDLDLPDHRTPQFSTISTSSTKNYQPSTISTSELKHHNPSTNSKDRRQRKSSNFLLQLQNAILQMGLPIPICCDVDKNGYIRERKTGGYLVDQGKSPMRVSQGQLKVALESGLILI